MEAGRTGGARPRNIRHPGRLRNQNVTPLHLPNVARGLLRKRSSLAETTVVSWSVGRTWTPCARRLHLIMKHTQRYLQVVHPGIVSGVAFVTAYEIENFHATANDDLPAPEFVGASSDHQSSPWARATGRLSGAFRRLLPRTLRRKAAA